MWNRNRCKVYSSNVQMKFPRKKQRSVFTIESGVIDKSWSIGSAALSKKEGRGPVNWNSDRKNRYAVMGPHTMGTTYHSVRVHICTNTIN